LLAWQKKTVNLNNPKSKAKKLSDGTLASGAKEIYVLDMLLPCAPGSGQLSAAAAKKSKKLANAKPSFRPASEASIASGKAEWLVVPTVLQLVDNVSSVRLHIPPDVRSKDARAAIGQTMGEVKKRFTGTPTAPPASTDKASKDKKKKGSKDKDKSSSSSASSPSVDMPAELALPLLDPVKDMKINDTNFLKLQSSATALSTRLASHKYHPSNVASVSASASSAETKQQLQLYLQRRELDDQLLKLKQDLKSATQDTAMHQQLKHMQSVLRRLDHTTSENVISLKGRIACEISTCDELLATELMFNGVFNELSVNQTVALCSCLVFNEKSSEEDVVRLKEDLAAPLRQLQDAARRVATVQQDARIMIDIDEYVARFQPQLMEVVYAWCSGAKFSEVCKMTDVFEGTIIRCLRRLEELLRQFAQAARSVGNELLDQKFTAGIELLKRDIVFAASLYL